MRLWKQRLDVAYVTIRCRKEMGLPITMDNVDDVFPADIASFLKYPNSFWWKSPLFQLCHNMEAQLGVGSVSRASVGSASAMASFCTNEFSGNRRPTLSAIMLPFFTPFISTVRSVLLRSVLSLRLFRLCFHFIWTPLALRKHRALTISFPFNRLITHELRTEAHFSCAVRYRLALFSFA